MQERNERLERDRIQNMNRRQNETAEQREERLENSRIRYNNKILPKSKINIIAKKKRKL